MWSGEMMMRCVFFFFSLKQYIFALLLIIFGGIFSIKLSSDYLQAGKLEGKVQSLRTKTEEGKVFYAPIITYKDQMGQEQSYESNFWTNWAPEVGAAKKVRINDDGNVVSIVGPVIAFMCTIGGIMILPIWRHLFFRWFEKSILPQNHSRN